MTPEQFKHLSTGDLVRHINDKDIYVVTANFGSHITAVKTVDMTNPPEWVLVGKADYLPREQTENTAPLT